MQQKIKILSVNISEKKGTQKKPVEKININNLGVSNDAHSGDWHRQVSMLGIESVNKFSKQAGREINYGEFAENITTEGIELFNTLPLDKFYNERVNLEVTQIGKECHGSNCSIYKEVGNCVMPKEGIFCRVISGGDLKAGDSLYYEPKIFKFFLITLSDRAYKGEYADKSGPKITEIIEKYFSDKKRKISIETIIIPDDPIKLKELLIEHKKNKTDFIITTGGTGIGARDYTPDVVKPMLDKEIPGIMELIRVKYGSEKPNALLSRSVAGIMDKTFVYTLPGSVKGVEEYMNEIIKTLEHSVYMINGIDMHH